MPNFEDRSVCMTAKYVYAIVVRVYIHIWYRQTDMAKSPIVLMVQLTLFYSLTVSCGATLLAFSRTVFASLSLPARRYARAKYCITSTL